MAGKEMTLLPTSTAPPPVIPHHRHENGAVPLNQSHQLLFQNTGLLHCFPPFNRNSGDPGPKTTRELTAGFIDDSHRFFQQQQPVDFSRPVYATPVHAWNVNDENVLDDDDDDEDDEDEDDDEDDVEVKINEGSNTNSTNKISNNGKPIHFSASFGSNRGLLVKESNGVPSADDSNVNDMSYCNNVGGSSCGTRADQLGTIAGTNGDLYYSQPDHEGSASAGQKDVSFVENGCAITGRKDGLHLTESGESLRKILSDPLTGSLMDDAMILPCGHTFGGGGMQHVIKMKACYTCSQPVSEDSVANNLSLRAAVQAFRREEEMQVHRASKRRREKFEQDKSNYGDVSLLDQPRGKGVQFPFSLTDRVIIKGNKRTPQRFVGREAVVTTQCLNGWYVVKTLDNAESVKLQYRSLAKVSDDVNAKPVSTKLTPNWL